MSYNIELKAESGQVTVENVSGEVPDGHFTVWGHEGGGQVASLSVSRRDSAGQFAGSASHAHPSA